MMKFIHEKYESIWLLSSILACSLLIVNNLSHENDYFLLSVFVLYALFMSAIAIINKKYQEKSKK